MDEYLAQLKAAHQEWKIDDGAIRLIIDKYCYCPYTYLAKYGIYPPGRPWQLFAAVDNKPGHDTNLRQRLLESCHLIVQSSA